MTSVLTGRSWIRPLALLAVGVLAASGCGTTVATSAGRSADSGIPSTGSDAGGAPFTSGPQAGVDQPGVPGGTRVPGAAPGVDNSAGARATGGTVSGGATAGAAGRGFDAHHVYIGFNTINNADTFFKTVGAGNQSFGNMKADAEAVLADINAHGGILGRKVVGVYHDEDVTQAISDPSSNAQSTCAAFTQDTKVVAAVINDGFDNIDTFYKCMAKADTPFFTGIDNFIDQKLVVQYRGYLHSTLGPTADVFAPVFISRLAALRYFSPWDTASGGPGSAPVKLGLLFDDAPSGRRTAALVARLLAARGIASEQYFYAATDLSSAAAAINNAVLKFRTDGVTHVIAPQPAVDDFMVVAEQQHYRPRYGVHSLMQLTGAVGLVPAAQLVGALGVGWQPIFDVGRSEGAAAASCLRTLARRGINYAGQLQATEIALIICDSARVVVAALNAGRGLSTRALGEGLAQAGPTFQPALTFRAGFSGVRADIVGAVRDIGYSTSCSCFTYLAARLWPVT